MTALDYLLPQRQGSFIDLALPTVPTDIDEVNEANLVAIKAPDDAQVFCDEGTSCGFSIHLSEGLVSLERLRLRVLPKERQSFLQRLLYCGALLDKLFGFSFKMRREE